MDNNILELDDKMLFIKFAYFSLLRRKSLRIPIVFFSRLWRRGTSDLLTANAFVSFCVFLIFFQLFVDQMTFLFFQFSEDRHYSGE